MNHDEHASLVRMAGVAVEFNNRSIGVGALVVVSLTRTFITDRVVRRVSHLDFDVISVSRAGSTSVHFDSIRIGIEIGFDVDGRVSTTRYNPVTVMVVMVSPTGRHRVTGRVDVNYPMVVTDCKRCRTLSGH